MYKYITPQPPTETRPGYCKCGCGELAPIATKTANKFGLIKGQPARFITGHQFRRHISERFWEHVDIKAPDECWEWQGSLSAQGYGRIKIDSRSIPAHCVAYELAIGPVLDDMFVCHSCDNRPCCNPAHLWQGTCADNNWDKARKGRANSPAGIKNTKAKLVDQEVIEIREKYATGEFTCSALSEIYKVTDSNIEFIVKGRSWKHINYQSNS